MEEIAYIINMSLKQQTFNYINIILNRYVKNTS